MTEYMIKKLGTEGFVVKWRGSMFHVADTREEAERAVRLHVEARVKADNKAILGPVLHAAADAPADFGDPAKTDDYRAWPDPDKARKLRAERVDYNACPYCGKNPCPGTHADCRSK